MSAIYRGIISVADKFVPAKLAPFWNHPAGPKTIFFWAPSFKWGLVIAGIADIARPAEKLSPPQSTALAATAYKEKLNNYLELLETDSKYTFWFKLSSFFSKIDEDVVFGIVYIPPENSVYHQPDTFDQVENEIRSFSQNFKYICLLGDFNGRTADEPDYFEIETHEHEQDFSEFMQDNLNCLETLNIDRKRKSMDTVKNRSGQKLLELCKGNDLFIVNGRIGDDKHESDKEKLQVLYTDLEETLSDNLDKDKVNSFVSKLSNLFIKSAKNTFGSRKDTQKRKSTNKKPKGDKPWFNEECRFERQNYRKLKRKLKFRKTDTLKREVSEAEKRYKNTLDLRIVKSIESKSSKLKYMKTSDRKSIGIF
ncbi:MPC2 [Mytilus edulis]|uniref:Mitochondrial pyruvate carrier n=1 Tax=Mytilus edulis TaxID=6550 RepID=A0A8S3VP07_MYTED|nr:MPC2 [Mytilus edulis]